MEVVVKARRVFTTYFQLLMEVEVMEMEVMGMEVMEMKVMIGGGE